MSVLNLKPREPEFGPVQNNAGTDLDLPASPPTADAGIDRLERWVQAASAAHQLVAPMVLTPFVPDAYRPRVDPRAPQEEKDAALEVAIASATAAVLYGASLGLDPMTALQQIYIVKGRPGMYAKAKVALLTAHGHQVWTDELDDNHAIVCGRRKGTSRVERVQITMDMARKAGWTSNEAYGKTPQDLLWARAAGRVCDRIAPDVILGIGSVEDLEDIAEPIRVTVTTGTPAPALTGADIIAHAATEPDTPPAVPEPERVETKPSDTALKRVFALLKQTGLEDRPLALAYISELVGRSITSRNELTATEVRQVTAALEVRANGS